MTAAILSMPFMKIRNSHNLRKDLVVPIARLKREVAFYYLFSRDIVKIIVT